MVVLFERLLHNDSNEGHVILSDMRFLKYRWNRNMYVIT